MPDKNKNKLSNFERALDREMKNGRKREYPPHEKIAFDDEIVEGCYRTSPITGD